MHLKTNEFKTSSFAFILTAVLVCAPQLAQAGDPYTTRNHDFGVSGGNRKDRSQFYCCSGTLGSLVVADGTRYILSCNHVLARQGQALIGEDILQPGLIDTGCNASTVVADLTQAIALADNVDCAVAELRAGRMDPNGIIEGYGGAPSRITASPTVGLAVAKSGRTTGHTTGTIGSINTSVDVLYQRRCNTGNTVIFNFTNQVVINSTTFSDSGDSGSLITTNDGCYHPVALLFAGNSDSTIGNPIDEVLTKLSMALGATLSFVGTNCTDSPFQQAGAQSFQLPQQALDQANRVLEQNRQYLMSQPAVLGVGLGALEDNSAPAIVVYVDKTSSSAPQLLAQMDNVLVRIIMTDPFVAF